MSKPIPAAMSAAVRSRPIPSTEEIRGEVETPPDPPLLVGQIDLIPIEVRRFRVEVQGSRRKRDLAAVAADDARRHRERMASVDTGAEAAAVWDIAHAKITAAVPASTAELWLRPLQFAGGDDHTLFLAAPDGIRSWVERRYASLILEAAKAAGAPWSEVSFT